MVASFYLGLMSPEKISYLDNPSRPFYIEPRWESEIISGQRKAGARSCVKYIVWVKDVWRASIKGGRARQHWVIKGHEHSLPPAYHGF